MLEHEKKVAEIKADYQQKLAEWEEKVRPYFAREPEAVLEYCETILSNSKYPSYLTRTFDLGYNPETQVLVVDYQLPSFTSIQSLNEVWYVNENTEDTLSESDLNQLYDNLLYMIALRTLHELFEADITDAFGSIAFNCYVHSIDVATGHEVDGCVLSLLVSKDEFTKLNLRNVDPKACFRSLKGVANSNLYSFTPITPILKIDQVEARSANSNSVVAGMQVGDNLATMDWEDFEHRIRELFEKEFSDTGSEVKVTRASRDGGIDAVIFDPDPLRGGKIVIQVKRYTNTVSAAAVRDLYGAVLNEGANKGILVTTSDYGPDAYAFAKNKPLVLLNGANLLSLLEKHGYKAG